MTEGYPIESLAAIRSVRTTDAIAEKVHALLLVASYSSSSRLTTPCVSFLRGSLEWQ
jgi:hypothetical protein